VHVEAAILDHRFSHVTCHLIKKTAGTHTYIRDISIKKDLLLRGRHLITIGLAMVGRKQ
jgi:hypothetical protein